MWKNRLTRLTGSPEPGMCTTIPGVQSLPRPFDGEKFIRLRVGIYDDPEVEVYVNSSRDFAFLSPRTDTDYHQYKPRVEKLDLQAYKKKNSVYARRHEKLTDIFVNVDSMLEIGAGDGEFLKHIHDRHEGLTLACIEPDQATKPSRDQRDWLTQYDDFAAASRSRFDLVCFFHVLEHIIDPAPFISNCAELLSADGRLIIEVPSMDDPLLSLYRISAYEDFFFQKQHPYSYTAASLGRLLRHLGFEIERMIPHQRYGLENHLNWLCRGAPGGNDLFRQVFGGANSPYVKSLEESGHTDAVIAIARSKIRSIESV